MLRIWQAEDGDSRVALRLEGRLGGVWVGELERLCEDLFTAGKDIVLDLSDVGFIDERGVEFIRLVSSLGATVASTSPFVAARLLDWNDRIDRFSKSSKHDSKAGGVDS